MFLHISCLARHPTVCVKQLYMVNKILLFVPGLNVKLKLQRVTESGTHQSFAAARSHSRLTQIDNTVILAGLKSVNKA